MSIKHVILLGSGHAATNIGKALHKAGIIISHVYSPTLQHAQELAQQVQAVAVNSIDALPTQANLYIIAVKDEAINEVATQLQVEGIVVHVSGNANINLLEFKDKFGVFYALQTFNKQTSVEFSNVPILVEASSTEVQEQLLELAHLLSKQVHLATSAQRQLLHVAAVFANNFTNHILAISQQLMAENNLPFQLLHPLIQQTLNNALSGQSAQKQTGPAIRFDEPTIQNHLELLKSTPELEELYSVLTKNIQTFHSKNQ
jgi:predicted short-subunit dehydrogenase-like oxidoreductase (DUF2520 family)